MQRYLVDTFWLLQIDRLKRVKHIGESYQRPTLFAFEGDGRDAIACNRFTRPRLEELQAFAWLASGA